MITPIYFIQQLDTLLEMRACRTCMSRHNLSPLFGEFSAVKFTSEQLILVTGVKIKPNDGLPQWACTSCIKRISKSLDLREICRKADWMLRKLFNRYETGFKIKNKSSNDVTTNHNHINHVETTNHDYSSHARITDHHYTNSFHLPEHINSNDKFDHFARTEPDETTDENGDDSLSDVAEEYDVDLSTYDDAPLSVIKEIEDKICKKTIHNNDKVIICNKMKLTNDTKEKIIDSSNNLKGGKITENNRNVIGVIPQDEIHKTIHEICGLKNNDDNSICNKVWSNIKLNKDTTNEIEIDLGKHLRNSKKTENNRNVLDLISQDDLDKIINEICGSENSDDNSGYSNGNVKKINSFNLKGIETSTDKRREKVKKLMALAVTPYPIEGPIQCKICFKTVKKASFPAHAATHFEPEFPCQYCERKFYVPAHLRYHEERRHGAETGRKKHSACNQCDFRAVEKLALLNHIRAEHTGERPFVCDECGAAFRMRNNLKQHLVKHYGVKNLQCELCPTQYTRRSQLWSHQMRVHFMTYTYHCYLCTLSYKTLKAVKNHLSNVHGVPIAQQLKIKCVKTKKSDSTTFHEESSTVAQETSASPR